MKKLILASVAAGSLAVAVPQANASSLIGSQVTATIYYPNLSSPVTYSETATVGAGIEFPSGSILVRPGFSIIKESLDVGADTVTIAFAQNAQAGYGAFNGWVLDFNPSSPAILGVSLDPSSNFNVPVTFGPHQITENSSGISITNGESIVLDVDLTPSASAAPEPQALALIFSGLGLIAVSLSRKSVARSKMPKTSI